MRKITLRLPIIDNLQTQRIPFGATTKKRAFTLIELLVVCAIIGILATVVIINLTGAKENSKVASAVSLLTTVRKAAELYRVDTHQWPRTCTTTSGNVADYCTSTNDPFKNSNSVNGWNGPYFEDGIVTMVHPWGGRVPYQHDVILSTTETTHVERIVLDDDYGPGSTDNNGKIPSSAMLKIDRILDNNDLDTGSVRQSPDAIGEIWLWFPTN